MANMIKYCVSRNLSGDEYVTESGKIPGFQMIRKSSYNNRSNCGEINQAVRYKKSINELKSTIMSK